MIDYAAALKTVAGGIKHGHRILLYSDGSGCFQAGHENTLTGGTNFHNAEEFEKLVNKKLNLEQRIEKLESELQQLKQEVKNG